MSAPRAYHLDCAAVGIVAVAILLALSLGSYDPADPPTDHVYPANETVSNWCGPVGASLASAPAEILGLTSFGLVGMLVLAALAVFRRQAANQWAPSAAGIALLIVTGGALLDYLPISTQFATVGGAGGSLGRFVRLALEQRLSLVGTLVLLIPGFFAALLLTLGSQSLVFMRLLAKLATTIAQTARPLLSWRPPRVADVMPKVSFPRLAQETVNEEAPSGDETADDEDDEEEESDASDELEEDSVKIVRSGFDIPEIIEETAAAFAPTAASEFVLPSLELLDDAEPFEHGEHEQEIRERARLLERTFAEFEMKVKVVQIDTGPVVTQYELELEPGLRARKVMALSDDIAIALKAPSVRIVAPIPGKNTVGVEVPNARRAKVGLKEVMLKSAALGTNHRLPMYLGKDVKGQPLVYDLASMPHLLIAGRTGTGKSVCLNSLILSVLMTRTPEQVKMLMIDPKMVELSLYKSIPHLLHPVVTDMKKAEALLAWAVEKMEERYSILARVGVRHIDSYNALEWEEICGRMGLTEDDEERKRIPRHMPYILIFADEMADLMMTSAKEVEGHIIRLAQKSRAVGIHLVLATQKPTVDVITGLIKSNLPARIAFQVASRTDSRVVLDEMGADKLLGNGDMLFLYPGTSKIVRAQGTFVSDQEVTGVVEYLSSQARPQFSDEILLAASAPRQESGGSSLSSRDELYESAVEVIVREQRGSVSLLQRALGIGYGRAARLVDYMAEDGIVGEYNGAQAREVMVKPEQWDDFRKARFAQAG